MRSSSATTIWASSTSWCSIASRVRSRAELTRLSPSSALASSRSQLLLVLGPRRRRHQPNFPVTYCSVRSSSGVVKSFVGRPDLDQLAVEHEDGGVGDPRRLLHVVGDDDDRHALLQLADELLDLQRRDRVEGRAGLVHQQHLGLDRHRPGDAEALLLAARETDPRALEAVLDLVPEAGPDQRFAAAVVHLAARGPGQPQAGDDVVEDRHRRERVRFLEDHADSAPDGDDVDPRVVEVEPVEQDLPLGAGAVDLFVHAVDAADHRRLAAPRRTDDRGHLVGGEVEVDAAHGVGGAVVGVAGPAARPCRCRAARGAGGRSAGDRDRRPAVAAGLGARLGIWVGFGHCGGLSIESLASIVGLLGWRNGSGLMPPCACGSGRRRLGRRCSGRARRRSGPARRPRPGCAPRGSGTPRSGR